MLNGGAAAGGRVVVVGSLNHDIVTRVRRWLAPGETLLADTLSRGNGGKGGNQAIAVARGGVPVTMIGAIGDDPEGRLQVAELSAHGIDTSALLVSPDVSTSLACVTVGPDAENMIVVTPGANDLLTAERVMQVLDGLDRGDIVLVLAQSEIGGPGCDAAAAFAGRAGARFVLSNGPVAEVSPQTWQACDPVVVNVHEARDVLHAFGIESGEVTEDDLARAVCHATGARSVVVTRGRDGSLVGPLAGGGYEQVPAETAAAVVDTTGAGDTYCGALVAQLALGAGLIDACRAGSRAGARAVGWAGARPPVTAG